MRCPIDACSPSPPPDELALLGARQGLPDGADPDAFIGIVGRAVEEGKLEEHPSGGLEAKFDGHDIAGWAGSLFTWWRKLRPFEFIEASAKPEAVPDAARVGLLADWGSGLYGAPVSAESIVADGRFDAIFHMGDVYYSGENDEVQERFLDVWPSVSGAVNRACNGNHEMYTGGQGYAARILPAFGQQASYFAMQNDHWLLVGLDTAYKEHDLHGGQAEWLGRPAREAWQGWCESRQEIS